MHSVENSEFSVYQILREIKVAETKSQNLPLVPIKKLWILILMNFCTFKAEISQITKIQSL